MCHAINLLFYLRVNHVILTLIVLLTRILGFRVVRR